MEVYKSFLAMLRQHWLRLLVNGAGVALSVRTGWMVSKAPLLAGWALFTDSPALRDIVLFTGKSGLILLVLSLACTPLARLLGWTTALQVRKALGLWGFGFACFHSLFFLQGKQLLIGLNIGSEVWQALQEMVGIIRYGSKVPYAEAGVYALLFLIPLALTSNRLAMRWLGKNWKRLHRLVYLAVPVAVYHYWWRTVTDFPVPPTPGYWQPILFAGAVGLLLLVRIPPVRRWVAGRLPSKRLRTRERLPNDQLVLPKPAIVTPRPREHSMIVSSPPITYANGSPQQKAQKQERVVAGVEDKEM